MKEVWKDIPGYEDKYQVSNYGKVKSLKLINRFSNIKREKILKSGYDKKTGYTNVTLYINQKSKTYKVHRLVAEAFIPNPNNYPCINHKDGNKQNNNITNLEWCNYSYNMKHAIKNGLVKIKKIKQYDLQGNYIKTWNSQKEISEVLEINQQSISKCCRGERNKTGGFIWKY